MAGGRSHSPPKGTTDLLPDDAEEQRTFEADFARVARLYAFRPIATPLFEQTELFERSVGVDTDIVTKEMYTFPDRGGRSLTLRPEGTAPVVRAFLDAGVAKSESLPWKVWYSGAMFRYERPQKGRTRQFHQVGAEAIGSHAPSVDVEIIEFAVRFLDSVGARFELHLNSIGDDACRPAYTSLLAEYVRDAIRGGADFCDDCRRRLETTPLRILDCKKPGCSLAMRGAPEILDHLCTSCASHFAVVRAGLEAVGIAYEISPRLVRGLDYYTRTAFEFRGEGLDSAQDSIGGGGRYDGLAEVLGGEPTPAVGFAIGIERTLLVCDRRSPRPFGVDAYVMPLGAGAEEVAMILASSLRAVGISCEVGLEGRSLKSMMRHADRSAAGVALIIGPEEVETGEVVIRTLSAARSDAVPARRGPESGIQSRVRMADAVTSVRRLLDADR